MPRFPNKIIIDDIEISAQFDVSKVLAKEIIELGIFDETDHLTPKLEAACYAFQKVLKEINEEALDIVNKHTKNKP